MRKPYFKKTRQCWYVTDARTRREVRLDPDEETAFRLWREMLDAATTAGPHATYSRLAEEFLQQNFEDRPRFHQDAQKIVSFVDHIKLKRASDVSKKDVVGWLNGDKPGQRRKDPETGKMVAGKTRKWSQRTKKDAYDAVCRVYRWAVRDGLISRNPIAGIKIQSGNPRSSVISPEQYRKLLDASDPCLRLYLIACAASGARPRQVREVTLDDVLPDFSAWVFYRHKSDRHDGGKPLVVYLPPCLQTITRALAAARPKGPLFLNSRGAAWKKDTVVKKISRLRKKLGLPDSVINYAMRHTFATDSLLQGNDLQTVAMLLGHKDARMVSRVYGHLDQHRHFLSEAAAKTASRRHQE